MAFKSGTTTRGGDRNGLRNDGDVTGATEVLDGLGGVCFGMGDGHDGTVVARGGLGGGPSASGGGSSAVGNGAVGTGNPGGGKGNVGVHDDGVHDDEDDDDDAAGAGIG